MSWIGIGEGVCPKLAPRVYSNVIALQMQHLTSQLGNLVNQMERDDYERKQVQKASIL